MNDNEEEASKYSLNKVYEYYNAANYGRAFAHYTLCLELNPENHKQMEDLFVNITRLWCQQLESYEDDIENIRFCYNQALHYYPQNLELLSEFAAHYNRSNEDQLAIKYFQLAHTLYPDDLQTEKNVQSVFAKVIPQWHFRMLNDTLRNKLYKEAIEYTIELSKNLMQLNIVDVGTGTGLLSIFAQNYTRETRKKPFETQIVAIENCAVMSELARNNFQANNSGNSDTDIKLITGLSTSITNQCIYNLLITEIFDCCLFGEGALKTLIHAHLELLAKNAIVLPYSAKLFMFGIESEEIDSKYRFRRGKHFENISFKVNKCIKKEHEPYDALSINQHKYRKITEVYEIGSVNFNSLEQLQKIYNDYNAFDIVRLKASEDGVLHAFIIYFELFLDQEETYKITTNPLLDSREGVCECWEQGVVFPLHSFGIYKKDEVFLHVDGNNDRLNISLERVVRNDPYLSIERMVNDNCWKVCAEALNMLNFKKVHLAYTKCIENMLNLNITSQLNSLEVASFPVFSSILHRISLCKNQNIRTTILLPEQNILSSKSLFELNQICLDNNFEFLLNTSKNLEHIARENIKFNCITFEPVLENGLINESFYANINFYKSLLHDTGYFFPSEVILCFELVESVYLQHCTQADSTLFDVRLNNTKESICSGINKYSVLEMRSLSGNFKRKRLSKICRVPIAFDEDSHEFVESVELIDCGKLTGFLYWCELKYCNGVVDTRQSGLNMAAFVLALDQVKYIDGSCKEVEVKIKQHCGLLKIYLD